MSQAKVDYNKEQKHNRKKIVKKQKTRHALGIVAGVCIAVVLVGWIGFSVYKNYEKNQAEHPTQIALDSSALTDYLSNIQE